MPNVSLQGAEHSRAMRDAGVRRMRPRTLPLSVAKRGGRHLEPRIQLRGFFHAPSTNVSLTLPSDPASRRRPCAPPILRHPQAGSGLPPSCRAHSAHRKSPGRLPGALELTNDHRQPLSADDPPCETAATSAPERTCQHSFYEHQPAFHARRSAPAPSIWVPNRGCRNCLPRMREAPKPRKPCRERGLLQQE